MSLLSAMPAPFSPPADLLDRVRMSRRPLLIAHISPDGDAIGSLLAAGSILYHLGKDPVLACQDTPPASLSFLPRYDRITNQVHEEVDLVIALDSSDRERLGNIYDQGRIRSLPLVVIDHHITNTLFGDCNWIEPRACATAEMIFDLAQALEVTIDTQIATCLLTGIVTDTRGFRTSSTTPRVMRIVSALMETGADLPTIADLALEARSTELIQLWGRAIATITVHQGVISADNTLEMRVDLGRLIRAEGLASFLLGSRDAQIAVVFTELPDQRIECSFRAQPGQDVAAVAYAFGGGGHALAAGCTVDGPLEAARERVLARLYESLRR
ncbi:MAG: DHH family phosphoesterase [Caldilineales bacterium]|nr:DHH family phosphoesterase [Caldilineales bacterium]